MAKVLVSQVTGVGNLEPGHAPAEPTEGESAGQRALGRDGCPGIGTSE